MRTATVAKLSLTAMVGLGSLIAAADLAQAGPGPAQQGSFGIAPTPTTSTTVKVLGPSDLGIAVTPTTVAPLPGDKVAIPEDDDCTTPACTGPGNEITDQGCTWTHGCPGGGTGGSDGGTDGGTKGTDGGTDGATDGGTDGSDRGTDGGTEGTDGQADRGTDGPTTTDGGQSDGGGTGGGRLPKTGGDVLTIAGTGLGLTGLGAALRRLGRRRRQG